MPSGIASASASGLTSASAGGGAASEESSTSYPSSKPSSSSPALEATAEARENEESPLAELELAPLLEEDGFAFEDEVAIRVTETDTGARIDMRSRSRLGQIDRGANARRIEAFLSALATRAGT